MIPQTIQQWHTLLASRDMSLLNTLLADNVVFYSPVVHTPQQGKAITTLYLSAAAMVLGNEHFRYLRETCVEDHAILEFETKINGIHVNGVDIITWNDENKITEFKVMIRPLKAINTLHDMMGNMLKSL